MFHKSYLYGERDIEWGRGLYDFNAMLSWLNLNLGGSMNEMEHPVLNHLNVFHDLWSTSRLGEYLNYLLLGTSFPLIFFFLQYTILSLM